MSCSAEQRPDLFDAAQGVVGALGVFSTVTLQCVPPSRWPPRGVDDVDQVLARFDEFAAGNDHFEFYFPVRQQRAARAEQQARARRRGRDPSPMPGWRRFLEYEVMENAAFGALCRTGRAMPRLIKPLNRLASATLSTRRYSAPRTRCS